MLVRIKGVIQDVIMRDGLGKSTNKPWSKKVYVIKDNTFNEEEKNTIVHVQDFGKADPNADVNNPSFFYHSDFVKGEEVDLMCWLETNDMGFTNVNYWKTYEEMENHKSDAVPTEHPATTNEEPVLVPPTGDNTQLPF